MTAPVEEGPPTGGGSGVFSRRIGNFPMWVWLGLGLAVALAYANWHKSKTAAANQQNTGALPTTQTASGSEPASLIPQFVNQVYDNPTPPVVNVDTPVTVNNNEPQPPATPPPTQPPPVKPPTKPPTPGKPPAPKPKPPAGQWVTVGVWNSTNAPWNSTLWGIAQHIYGNGALYPKIFAANKTGVMRPDGTAGFITNPNLIHPGDRVWVPA